MVSLEFVLNQEQLFVRQIKEWIEIAVDWETTNRYEVLTYRKERVLLILERGGIFWTKIKRAIFRSHRPLSIDVVSSHGDPVLTMSRPFFFFFSTLKIQDAEGVFIGSVHRRLGLIFKKYDLRDREGRTFASIRSPLWRLWTFPVRGSKARVTKRWGGVLREAFTDADTYLVDFGGEDWDLEQRAVFLSAAISIDFDFFENNVGGKGVLRSDN